MRGFVSLDFGPGVEEDQRGVEGGQVVTDGFFQGSLHGLQISLNLEIRPSESFLRKNFQIAEPQSAAFLPPAVLFIADYAPLVVGFENPDPCRADQQVTDRSEIVVEGVVFGQTLERGRDALVYARVAPPTVAKVEADLGEDKADINALNAR